MLDTLYLCNTLHSRIHVVENALLLAGSNPGERAGRGMYYAWDGKINAYTILVGQYEQKWSLRTPKRMSEDNIKAGPKELGRL
jgi:hypothetical protein